VTDIAKAFGLSRQGFYYWKNKKDQENKDCAYMRSKVLEIRKRQARIGGRKLIYLLQDDFFNAGIKIGRDKFFDFLASEFLLVRPLRKTTRTTRRAKRFRQHPNLIQDIEIKKPEQVWVSDVTYVHHKHGTAYLHLTTDAYSKKIVGYKLSDDIKADTTLSVIKSALKKRQFPNRRLIHHSDRGFNYTARKFTEFLNEKKVKISMTNKYDPYENAIAERVNGILKQEFSISGLKLLRSEIENLIKQAIFIYNNERPHLSCNYLTPEQAHKSGRYKLPKWSKYNFSKN